MANFDFKFADKRSEVAANHMFFLRIIFLVATVIALIPACLMFVKGEDWMDLVEEDGRWWSIQGIGEEEFNLLQNPFVCGFPMTGNCSTIMAGSKPNELGTRCLSFHQTHSSFDAAEKVCYRLNGTLASIHSEEDNKMVSAWCKSDSPCWFGMTRAKDAEYFEWMDETVVVYQNWYDHHPMNKFETNDYGAIAVFGYKRWAKSAMVIGGLSGIILISLEIIVVAVLLFMTRKALMEKDVTLMHRIAIVDAVQTALMMLILFFFIGGLTQAYGSGVGGGFFGVIIMLVLAVFLCYLAHIGCMMKVRIADELRIND